MKNHSYDLVTFSMASVALACTAALTVLTGCGPQNGEPVPAAQTETRRAAPAKPVARADVGYVSHIETLTERPKGTGVGAVAGGVIGGVAGHQIGDGDGRKLATAAGAIGGALLGNKIERDRREQIVGYDVQVQLDNGQTRTFRRTALNGLQVGSRVKLEGGVLQPA